MVIIMQNNKMFLLESHFSTNRKEIFYLDIFKCFYGERLNFSIIYTCVYAISQRKYFMCLLFIFSLYLKTKNSKAI